LPDITNIKLYENENRSKNMIIGALCLKKLIFEAKNLKKDLELLEDA